MDLQASFLLTPETYPIDDFSIWLSLNGCLSSDRVIAFQTYIWNYHLQFRRPFLWRDQVTPYGVFISEVMLQQTQTERVKEKFIRFMDELPSFKELAECSKHQLLSCWQGLGYNRRALWLQQSAQIIYKEYDGILPDAPEVLVKLPGIGPATASSIVAFAYNRPTVFIETNVRAVYLELFFKGQEGITDKQLLPLVTQTVDQLQPREWYYALMDFGVMLKKRLKNPSRRSAHHTRQSKFEGSERQIRGAIVRALTEHGKLSYEQLCALIMREPERIAKNLKALEDEKFIKSKGAFYVLE